MHDKFCNLHTHSCIGSPLDGYSTPDKMAQRAANLRQKALAITDHGTMTAIVSFKQACEQYGVKPIIGSELYIVPWGKDFDWRRDDKKRTGTAKHITALAYNQQGYVNLLKLTQLANEYGHYYVPRINYEMLEDYNAGLIVTSGCMASDICSSLNPETGVTNEDYKRVNKILGFMMDVFGRDRYFIELQGHNIPALVLINKELERLNVHYNFKYLATNDSHYPVKSDAQGQFDVMCVNRGVTRYNPGDFIQGYLDHPGYDISSYDDMVSKDYGFQVPDSAFTNTLVVADMVEDVKLGYEPEVKQYRFPVMPEYEHDYDYELEKLVYAGVKNVYPSDELLVWDRVNYELEVINNLGFASYFLCIYDISEYCKKQSIPMTVRGSAGGSIVFYCLGITDFCPLEYDLIFERFLNPDRVSAPDADLDIDPNRRGEVIKYLVDKYGSDKAMQVITVNFIKHKQSIRDAARILGYDYSIGTEVIDAFKKYEEGIKAPDGILDKYHDVIEVANGLEGQTRQIGMHAGAVILSDRPLVMDFPVVKKSKKAITKMMVGINYEEVESLGGIKIDVLGVSALGVLYEAMRLINERHGTKYKFENIPVDDPISYELINSGNISEIFQLSGRDGRRSSAVIKPQNVFDVMVAISICRPGPNAYEQLYADRMHGLIPIEYKHPDLEPVLKDSQGIMLFQEAVMRVSQVIAGFTNGQADILRKSISKKKGFEKIKELFISGARQRGYSDKFIEELWDDMAKFNGYGFNMPHACAYARIAVKQAFLKAKYPIEYYAAALTGRGDSEERMVDLLKEMSKYGIKLLPPLLGQSKAFEFAIDDENNAVRFPYASIKNIGARAAGYLEKVEASGSISDNDLTMLRKCNTRVIETLALVGGLDHIYERNVAVSAAQYLSRGLRPVKQESFVVDDDKYTYDDFLFLEKEFTGMYLTAHPLDKYSGVIDQVPFDNKEEYLTKHGNRQLYYAIVNEIKLHRDRKGGLMAFVKVEDKCGEIGLVVFSKTYAKTSKYLSIGNVIRFIGEVSVDMESKYEKVSIIASSIMKG